MNLQENWKVIKPQNDPSQILDFFEHLLILSKKNSQPLNRDFTKNIIEHLSYAAITHYKSSQKSSIETACKHLERLLNTYPISSEFVFFCLQIGKFLKKQLKFPDSEHFFQKGLATCQKSIPLEPIHAVLLISLCKLLNKQKRHTEALRVAKQSSYICQEIVVSKNNLSTSELAEITCKAYYQVSIQEELLGKSDKSILWKQKAERILHQNAGGYAKLAEKITSSKNVRRTDRPKTRVPGLASVRNFPDSSETSRKRIVFGKAKKSSTYLTPNTQKTSTRDSTLRELERHAKKDSEVLREVLRMDESKIGSSDWKKMSLENTKSEERPNLENFQMLSPGISKDYLFGDYSITKKTLKCNSSTQTDEKVILEASTSTDGLNSIESTIRSAPKTKGKVLVKSSKIDIKQEEFEILYYLSQSFDKILIVLSNHLNTYNREIDISINTPVLDYISSKLHPSIDIEREEIILKSENISTLIEATIFKKDENLSIKIQKTDPRGEIIVNIGQGKLYTKKTFRVSEIFTKVHNHLKTPELLALCFDYYDEDIRVRLPSWHVPELLYYKQFKIYSYPSFYLKISRVSYDTCNKYLFQPISSSGFSCLIIDEMILSAFSSVPVEFLESHIEKISTLLNIRNNALSIDPRTVELDIDIPQVESPKKEPVQVQEEKETDNTEFAVKLQSLYRGYLLRKNIEKDSFFNLKFFVSGRELDLFFTDSTLNRKLTIVATDVKKKFYLVIRYPAPFKQPFKQSIPPLLRYRNKELFLKLSAGYNAFLFRNSQQLAENSANQEVYFGIDDEELILGEIPEDMYNKIIFRTCLKKNGMMYQVNMVLAHSNTDEDILNFYVRHGPSAENNQKCVIDLNTVCMKSGLSKHNLELIGNYVVNNMINFAGSDVSFLNFDNSRNKFETYLIKIQAFFRGMLTRKRISRKSVKVILKSHVHCLGRKWLCLFKSNGSDLFVQLVFITEVISKKLNLAKISNENPYPSLKDFFRSRIISKIKIEEGENGYFLSGIEEYEAPVD